MNRSVNRRSFLRSSALAGGAAAIGSGLLGSRPVQAQDDDDRDRNRGGLTRGDVAILRFLAAAELIESDLWQQYTELGGVSSDGSTNPYQAAFEVLDGDGPQYITSNTTDEISHETFLNAYLESKGEEPVNLDEFRTLQGSQATGAQNIGRLTNLMNLTVDTSWYIRYRSTTNPDFGATYPQAITLAHVTAIPRNDNDFNNQQHIQAIANTAAFHFGMIEQAGSSLYSALGQKATSAEVLEIIFAIGGDEVAHFLEWVDFAGNGVQQPVAPFTDPTNGLTFPDFNAKGDPLFQTNLIFPVPCEFISPKLPKCAVIRPVTDRFGGALAAANGLIGSNLFMGQSKRFLNTLKLMALEADAARRGHF
ncbi:twin-arginine translocation signal domain-containing protein [Acidobacterium sp. S8]|uniref:twin-arginine translocation signal domain-containing protein n=1 Tax=Acidobacterium sp. S8 TaxID=1641854 RepID=UPI0020B13772|nr:twin-arginine translocation signal domain-containing protein [Acidobacterium sp. S8]